MTSSSIVTLIGALIASITVTSAAVINYRREKFEQERILKLDDERAERNRMLIAMDIPKLGLTTPVAQQPIQMMYNPSTNSYMVPVAQQRPQVPVNWSDSNVFPRVEVPQTYGYGYGVSPNVNNGINMNRGTELTWNNNDALIRLIASKPPMPSPIFGVRR